MAKSVAKDGEFHARYGNKQAAEALLNCEPPEAKIVKSSSGFLASGLSLNDYFGKVDLPYVKYPVKPKLPSLSPSTSQIAVFEAEMAEYEASNAKAKADAEKRFAERNARDAEFAEYFKAEIALPCNYPEQAFKELLQYCLVEADSHDSVVEMGYNFAYFIRAGVDASKAEQALLAKEGK